MQQSPDYQIDPNQDLNNLKVRLAGLLLRASNPEEQDEVVIRIAQVNSLITRREEIKRYEDLELEVERKTRELEELEKQNQAAEEQLKIVTIQNAPLEQRIGELELLTAASSAQLLEEEAALKQEASQLSRLKASIARCMNIFDTYDEPSGARVVSAQETSANIIPPEHLVHTSFFAECSKAQDKAAFDIALSKLPHRDINHRDNKGKTPLIYTAEHGFAYGMQKLLEIKADASICDENGHNALYHATQMLHKECMQLLAEDSGIDSST